MATPSAAGSEPTIDDVIFNIEDYIGGNVENVEHIDRMGLTVFLRNQLEALNDASYEAVMATIKQLYGDVTEAEIRDYKVSELRQSVAKVFDKESNVREGL